VKLVRLPSIEASPDLHPLPLLIYKPKRGGELRRPPQAVAF
jgi:hypothetical protein